MKTKDSFTMITLIIAGILLIFFLSYIINKKNKKQLEKVFIITFSLILFWIINSILQIFCLNKYNINPIYFNYLSYISSCFLPVTLFFIALIFARTKINFKKKYLLLFIIPTISLAVLWTNNYHHLFYEVYSTNYIDTVFGKYFYINYLYTYIILGISLYILMKYSVKNSGFFSKQAISIIVGALIPIIANILGFMKIIPMSTFITPISFTFSLICLTIGIFKFELFEVAPIALQRIVDRMSDSYIVLNENNEISDFNKTFNKTFNTSKNIRGKDFSKAFEDYDLIDKIKENIEKVKNNNKVESFELYIPYIKKYFNVEITSIKVKNNFLGILVLFKDATQHVKDMKSLENNQDLLIEQERLASLGQMIGGIAHNLKTPIMSISGATEGLLDLIKEYDLSIDDPNVNSDDHHEIANDMIKWVEKIKTHTEYMSDIISAVKGQAVALSNEDMVSFTILELVKRVDILMKHELKKAMISLNISMKANEKLEIKGDVNSLVQIINNMISNSIQAYNGTPEQTIDLIVETKLNNLLITIRDYAGGLPEKVQKKLFKEMITTKGKNGTGLGLYMSYSTIKARFGGNITYKTAQGKGTEFIISLPM